MNKSNRLIWHTLVAVEFPAIAKFLFRFKSPGPLSSFVLLELSVGNIHVMTGEKKIPAGFTAGMKEIIKLPRCTKKWTPQRIHFLIIIEG